MSGGMGTQAGGLLRITDLTVRYAGRPAPVLSTVSLALDQGDRVLLLGPSGSGKTTLVLALAGLIPHVLPADIEGTVTVNGLDTRTALPAALARFIGVVFQDPDVQICMSTVEEEVAFGLENLGVAPEAMAPRIWAALDAVGMAGLRASRVDRLSGGLRQRLVLAAVLAMGAPTFVLDEPTAHLDPQGTREFFSVLTQLSLSSCLLIEHKLEHAVPLVTRVVALSSDGRVLVEGAPRDVFSQHAGRLEAEGIWLPPATQAARAVGMKEKVLTLEDLKTLTRGRPAMIRDLVRALPVARPPVSGRGTAITVRDLSYSYHRGANALREVSLSIPEGDFLALVGANGSGKTTLALHLSGILPPPPGRVFILGRDVADAPAGEVAGLIGYVFQNPEHQFVTHAVLDEIRYTLRAREMGDQESQARAHEVLRRFGLAAAAQRHPYQLSQGEKRRLSVATALAAAPSVLVLDEPTFGQDARTNQELLKDLVRLNERGLTILMITHDMEAVWQFARSVAIMHEGRIIHQGPVVDLPRHGERLIQAGLELPFAVRCREALGDRRFAAS